MLKFSSNTKLNDLFADFVSSGMAVPELGVFFGGLAAGLRGGFLDFVHWRTRLGGEGAVGFETQVFVKFGEGVSRATDAEEMRTETSPNCQ